MAKERFYLVAYDVRDPRRLKRVAKAMEDFAVRVQFSVFEANLTEASLEKMRTRVMTVMHEEDSLRIYSFCDSCRKLVEVKGGPPPAEDPPYFEF
jgi:CRISPR-associated protein Cas2